MSVYVLAEEEIKKKEDSFSLQSSSWLRNLGRSDFSLQEK